MADNRDGTGESTHERTETAATGLLRSLDAHGVEYVFANLGTDHTPLLEAAARLRERGETDALPDIVMCPHEFVAMSAAHGYAASTGRPQAVLVHVDVGTQNLGAAVHNAHRANVPVFVIAGLAPVTDSGHLGSRDHHVHYAQDVFDQTGIVREYCRWTNEYQPPTDPDVLVARALQRATASPPGPVYLSASREALETPVNSSPGTSQGDRTPVPTRPDRETLKRLVSVIESAERPLVITSDYDDDTDALVEFVEAAGAGVVEHSPSRVCFPRDHSLYLGVDPTSPLPEADLIVLAATDVPWIPSEEEPSDDAIVIQIDENPTKPAYPHWNFRVDETIAATPGLTFAALTGGLDGGDDSAWRRWNEERRRSLEEDRKSAREDGRLTPAVLSDEIDKLVDESTIIIEDAVTSRGAIMNHLSFPEGSEYYWKGGAGLGWSGGAAVGAKMANPDNRVIALTGDGAYFFAHPSASAWFSSSMNAPTLTIVYNNAGWNAVKSSTVSQHPNGAAATDGVAESKFDPVADLSAPAQVVDAYATIVEKPSELAGELDAALAALADGRPAVVDVRLDPI